MSNSEPEIAQDDPGRHPTPSDLTRQALADAEARRDLVGYAGTEELFADLGI